MFPSKLFFFCEEEPKRGGETPIVLSHVVHERIKQRFPKFVERLEEHGAIYPLVLGAEYDPSRPVRRSWQLTFSTQDKATAEERFEFFSFHLNVLNNCINFIRCLQRDLRYELLIIMP